MATFKHDPGPERDDLPQSLVDITKNELALWESLGPCVQGDDTVLTDEGRAVYITWPSWRAWARFYASVREELYSARPWRRQSSTAEKLYEAVVEGRDPVTVLDALDAARAANDPRRGLFSKD